MKKITIIEQDSNNYFSLYDNSLGTILRKFEGFEYPIVNESIDEVSGPYGSVYINSKFQKRILSIEGDLVSSDVFTLRRSLATALRQTGIMKLIKFTTYDDLDLQFEGEITKVINPYTHSVHTFMIEITAPDWRFYGQEEMSYNIEQSLIQGGSPIPTPIPMSFPVPVSLETNLNQIIVNNGSEVTDPIITIHGPGDGFIIGNLTTEEEFLLDRNLSSSDEVIIDIKKRTVILNDVTNIYSDVDGDFWSLIPGDNQIKFLVNADFDPELTTLNITFREAFLGI